MISLDIITLTTPVMTQIELRELCDEITRLRTVCGKISDEIDVVTSRKLFVVICFCFENIKINVKF